MSSTKYIIAEQVLFRLAGGYPDVADSVQREDVYKKLEQKINAKFKLTHLSETLASGETIPDGAAIATYEGIAVSATSNGKSKSTLPATPISLQRNMGIFTVYSEDYPDAPFIPLQRGQMALLKSDTLLSDLLGQIGYEPKSDQIIYNKDLTLLGINEVTMELVVFDMSQYSETDRLPIPAEYEDVLIEELVAEFSGVQPEAGVVNNFSTANQKTNK